MDFLGEQIEALDCGTFEAWRIAACLRPGGWIAACRRWLVGLHGKESELLGY